MRFRVGPWVYRVRITRGLTDDQRSPAAGLCDWESRTIWIEADMPVRNRLSVLLHELRHAWQHDLGRVADDENDARQAASFAVDAWRQLERQGGEMALMRLGEDGAVDSTADVDTPGEPRPAQCPTCSGLLNLPIRTAPPQFDEAFARLVSWRSADCDFCGHAISWREAVTSAGSPTGTVLGEPILGSAHVSDSSLRRQTGFAAC